MKIFGPKIKNTVRISVIALSLATQQVFACSVSGGFGLQFDESIATDLSYEWLENKIGIPSARFKPKTAYKPFQQFKMVVTPGSQRVFSLQAKRQFASHAAALAELDRYYQRTLKPNGIQLPKELAYRGLRSLQGTIDGTHIFISAEDEELTLYCRREALAHLALDELGVAVPVGGGRTQSWRQIARQYESEAEVSEPEPKKTPESNDDLYKERSTEDVMNVVAAQQEAILRLYYRALLRVPDLGGVINFALTIDAEGEVAEADIQDTNLGDKIFEARLLDFVKRIQFGARAGGGFQVVYPLFLSPP